MARQQLKGQTNLEMLQSCIRILSQNLLDEDENLPVKPGTHAPTGCSLGGDVVGPGLRQGANLSVPCSLPVS